MKKPSGTVTSDYPAACRERSSTGLPAAFSAGRALPARSLLAARAVWLAFPVAAAFLIASCDLFTYTRPFPDAYYEDNFIADIGFDRFVGDQGLAAIPVDPLSLALVPVTGSWDFAYRYDSGWSNDVAYMTLTDSGLTAADFDSDALPPGAVPEGLSPTAPVFRLELANLVTGGDFEGGIGGAWSFGSTVAEAAPLASTLGLPDSIHGTSLQVDFISSDQYALYSIQNALSTLVSGTGLDTNASYYLRFLSNGASLLYALTVDAATPLDETTAGKLNLTQNPVNLNFTPTGSDFLRFQRFQADTLILDDFSLTRADLNLQLRLRLTHYQSDPNLESFLYRFSYWVHEDGFANPANEAEGPWRLDTMTGDIQALYGVPLLPGHQSETYDYDASSSGWQKHTAYFIDKLTLPAKNSATEAVLELSIDLSSSLPGRILIAQPELRCYPDGY